MQWTVLVDDDFEPELADFAAEVQDRIFELAIMLQRFGPQLGRPHVDTLKGSKHANMKELRFDTGDGAWRVAFAFDTKRAAILLVAGSKSGVSQQRFYRDLIRKADERFDAHQKRIAKQRK